jgi:hypothetical protein
VPQDIGVCHPLPLARKEFDHPADEEASVAAQRPAGMSGHGSMLGEQAWWLPRSLTRLHRRLGL